MSNDKRVKENIENIKNLKIFLIDICKNSEEFNKEILSKQLKSQGGLSKIEIKERNIKKSSINTLKRISKLALEGGFDELDRLRIMAYEAISLKKENISKESNKSSLNNKIKALEEELNKSKAVQLLLVKSMIDDLNIFKVIKNTEDLELIKNFSENGIKRLTSLSVMSPELINIGDKSSSKIIEFNRDKLNEK